jgi:ferredoxin-NADP reductase
VSYDEVAMSLPATYQAHLKEKITLTDKVRDFVLELPCYGNDFEYEAGQFVLIKLPHPETGDELSRAYSIARAPQQGCELILNIEIIPDGRLTPLLDQVEVGEEIDVQGPFGYFKLKSPPEKSLVFVATSVGVAPLRAMIETVLNENPERKVALYFGVRSQEHIFYEKDFEELATKYGNFEFVLTLSQPAEGWEGSKGRVTAILPKIEFDSDTDFYLCGGKPMIDDAKKILLKKNIPEEQIYFEQFHL